MSRLLDRLRPSLVQVGTPGAVGIGLLAFAASLALGTLLPAYEDLQSARTRYLAIEQRVQTTAAQAPGSTEEARRQLDAFMRHFPGIDDARQDILRLQGFAANHGITLRSGEYRLAPERDIAMVCHQVTFPVTGPYLDIRAFIAEALEQLPSAALEAVSFRRDSDPGRAVEARLRFVLYTTSS